MKSLGSPSNVHLLEIDVTSTESIDKTKAEVEEKYESRDLTKEQLDKLVEEFLSSIETKTH